MNVEFKPSQATINSNVANMINCGMGIKAKTCEMKLKNNNLALDVADKRPYWQFMLNDMPSSHLPPM